VLAGAWGPQADELLEREHRRRRGVLIHRVDALAIPEPPHLVVGSWCGWLFGTPEDRGTLAARFGLTGRNDLPGAFARALSELGEQACELLCGRFVVVTLNRERGRCMVTRDQLGAQPLVYARVGDGVMFAEHERDLLELLPRTPGPDRLPLLQWIENGVIPQGRTLYEHIQSLPAGHRLVLEGGRVRIERWWSLRYQGTVQLGETELSEYLRTAAFAAVGRAATGSRRLAVKLSGGLDSACVAAGLQANGFTDGRGLALGGAFADHPEADESDLIEATAKQAHLPLELVAFEPESSILAPALAHIARWRLPPTTQNLFLWQPVTARAREFGVDLMLDGEGGDELFGLVPYLISDMIQRGRLRTAWSLTGEIPGLGRDPERRIRMRVLRRYGVAPLVPGLIQRRRQERARFSSPDSMTPHAARRELAELAAVSVGDRRDGPRWWRQLLESLIDTRDLLGLGAHFRREAADEGIERRHPFLYDLSLTEAALRLPPQTRFDPVCDRPLLRDALTGLIPEEVRARSTKSHFTELMHAGIRADESGLIEPLRLPDAPVRAYVAPAALERTLAVAPAERKMLAAGALWRVAIANRWLMSQSHDPNG
jgi:asparagine synthase (glutamine-hydrolysing)